MRLRTILPAALALALAVTAGCGKKPTAAPPEKVTERPDTLRIEPPGGGGAPKADPGRGGRTGGKGGDLAKPSDPTQ